MSNDRKVHSSDSSYQHMVKEYARIQSNASAGHSSKSEDIAKLRERFSSYFQEHKIDTSKRDKILGALDGMEIIARQQQGTKGQKARDKQWDKDRQSMDRLVKELAPAGTSASTLSKLSLDGQSHNASSSRFAATEKLEDVSDGDGAGFSGDLNDPASSKEYKGLSLDQLLASNSPIGAAMKSNPSLVEDIRQASARTGVPAGLMAATAYAESSFGSNAVTTKNVDGNATAGVFQGSQAWMDKYNAGGSLSNVKDNVNMFTNAMVGQYQRLGSWGGALRAWNSSGFDTPLPSASNLSKTAGAGDTNYVSNILGLIAMGHPPE